MAREPISTAALRSYLDPVVERFECSEFVQDDPISIPRSFDDPADQEVIALFAAILAWGRRDIMLKKLAELCERMDYQPAYFVRSYSPSLHRNKLAGFVHRTFNAQDAEGITLSLQNLMAPGFTLEAVFASGIKESDPVESALQSFSSRIINSVPGRPRRITKHFARPSKGSACKRLNMFLRWMVRTGPVDLGLWSCLNASDLILPLDVHSASQARNVGLLQRRSNDWKAAIELTENCRLLDPADPCKYDFALFGTGSAGEILSVPL